MRTITMSTTCRNRTANNIKAHDWVRSLKTSTRRLKAWTDGGGRAQWGPTRQHVCLNYNGRVKFTVPQPIRWRLMAFYCWYFTLRCDLDIRSYDLDHCLETFLVYRLCRSQTLYQIGAQSSNPRRSYCDFNIWPQWPWTCVTCCARPRIIFTKLELGQPILTKRFCRWYVMSRCNLDLWSLNLEQV